jgi:hypothetical protein
MSTLVPSSDRAGTRRLLDDDGTPEFSNHCGMWIILAPARTWAEWRDLAQAILDTEDPGGD